MRCFITVMLGTVLAAHTAAAQQPASEATRALHQAAAVAAATDEAREAEEDAAARRGFIAAIPGGVVAGPDGAVVFDWRPFAFLDRAEAPATVHPRLWRQARRNAVHGLFEVVPGAIWQVRGYDISVMTIVRGDSGLIIIDPLTTEQAAAASLALFRAHAGADVGQLPVRAVIFSHSHVDHFGGVAAVLPADPAARAAVRIIAPHGFAREAVSENVLAGTAMQRRAGYMFGTFLSPGETGQVDTGLGPRLAGGTSGYMPPTETLGTAGGALTIDGLAVEFMDAGGTEAPSEFVFHIPRYRALHMTEVATKTFHNLLTLRGAQVRDALHWSRVIDAALGRWGPVSDVALASHGWPTFGQAAIGPWLAGQRDIYRLVHDRTLNAANSGATIGEVSDVVAAVADRTIDPAARGYYGTAQHNARAVYQRYFGWWDGVPANFNPVPPEDAARGYVALAGGPRRLLAAGRAAMRSGNYRWAAELLNHLVFAGEGGDAGRTALADAYEQLGFQAESGAWRNYYLAAAATLRQREMANPPVRGQSPAFVLAIPTLDLFDALATRLAATEPLLVPRHFRFEFTDTGETVTVERRGLIEIPRLGDAPAAVTATVRTTRPAFAAMLGGRATPAALVASGQLSLSGDVASLQAWLAEHRPPDPGFPVVTP